MHYLRAISWHHWSLSDLDGGNSLMAAMFAVIVLWIVFDRMPLSVKYK